MASLAAIFGLLAQSMLCNIWGDPRMFFGFFIIMSLTCAYIRICRTEKASNDLGITASEFSASVDI